MAENRKAVAGSRLWEAILSRLSFHDPTSGGHNPDKTPFICSRNPPVVSLNHSKIGVRYWAQEGAL